MNGMLCSFLRLLENKNDEQDTTKKDSNPEKSQCLDFYITKGQPIYYLVLRSFCYGRYIISRSMGRYRDTGTAGMTTSSSSQRHRLLLSLHLC